MKYIKYLLLILVVSSPLYAFGAYFSFSPITGTDCTTGIIGTTNGSINGGTYDTLVFDKDTGLVMGILSPNVTAGHDLCMATTYNNLVAGHVYDFVFTGGACSPYSSATYSGCLGTGAISNYSTEGYYYTVSGGGGGGGGGLTDTLTPTQVYNGYLMGSLDQSSTTLSTSVANNIGSNIYALGSPAQSITSPWTFTAIMEPSTNSIGVSDAECDSVTSGYAGSCVIELVEYSDSGYTTPTGNIAIATTTQHISRNGTFQTINWNGLDDFSFNTSDYYGISVASAFTYIGGQPWKVGSTGNLTFQLYAGQTLYNSTGLGLTTALGTTSINALTSGSGISTSTLDTTCTTQFPSSGGTIGDLKAGIEQGMCNSFFFFFVPDSKLLQADGTQIHDDIFTRAPWGYLTLVIDTWNGVQATTSTSSLPALIFTLPPRYPGAGISINLTPWDKLLGVGTILDTATSTATGHTLHDVLGSTWSDFVYAGFFILLAFEIIGLGRLEDAGAHDVSDRKPRRDIKPTRL